MEEWNTAFLPDDFDRIYKKYFKKLVEASNLKYDPSGWLNTISNASKGYIPTVDSGNDKIVPYYTDYQGQINSAKIIIASLLSKWDDYEFALNEFTLCSSVTIGSLGILSALLNKNIKNIFFETPAYYASINQAKTLGFNYFLIPTYIKNNFALELDFNQLNKMRPYVLWVTQPRMSLGIDQDSISLTGIYSQMPNDCFMVIDEASEQLFPSGLHKINVDEYPRIIKIRNFYKGMGINGIRLSFIAHNTSLQEDIQRELENFQGAVDYFSLFSTEKLSEDWKKFKMMLEVSNNQTKTLRTSISRKFESAFLKFSPLINGYVGSLSVDLSKFDFPHRVNRENLLKHCYKNGLPLILGATMKFAFENQREFIRLNYFKSENEFDGALSIITKHFEEII